MKYEGIVYRPPSEFESLILQTTIGCPHNKCTFCNMYRSKKFRIRKVDEVLQDINQAALNWGANNVKSVFLADGSSIITRPAQLLTILYALYKTFPYLQRVTSYGATQYLAQQKLSNLKQLAAAGLTRIHSGMETGDDDLLAYIHKGATAAMHITGGQKVKDAGIELSFYVMPGLGGVERSEQHALGSARVLSAVQPNAIRLRTFVPLAGTQMAQNYLQGEYTLQSPHQTLHEIKLLVEHTHAHNSYLVSDHKVNYAPVQGMLPQDKSNIIEQLNKALAKPEHSYKSIGVTSELL